MNIPPKYEDVVANLDAALSRETALREELSTLADDYCEKVDDLIDLQQRLTVAEQWADELQRQIDILWKEDKWSQEWKADKDFVFFANRHAAHDAHGNSFGWIDEVPFFYRQHCFEAFRAGVALKPAAEGEGS